MWVAMGRAEGGKVRSFYFILKHINTHTQLLHGLIIPAFARQHDYDIRASLNYIVIHVSLVSD